MNNLLTALPDGTVDFRNRRPDFISNFFGLINWDKVAERFAA